MAWSAPTRSPVSRRAYPRLCWARARRSGASSVLQQVDSLGEVGDGLSGVGTLEVQAGPVEQGAAQLGAALEKADRRRVVREGGAGVSGVLVQQAQLRPDSPRLSEFNP